MGSKLNRVHRPSLLNILKFEPSILFDEGQTSLANAWSSVGRKLPGEHPDLLGEVFGAEPVGEEFGVRAGAVDALYPEVGAALFHKELTTSAARGEDVSGAIDRDDGNEFPATGEV